MRRIQQGTDYRIWFWEKLSQEQLEEMIEALPPFRREKALSYVQERDRVLCAKSYLMLCGILREKYGISRQPEFDIRNNGKPYLRGIDKFFNLSHCQRGIICAVSDAEVGCDIEEIPSSLDVDLCRACFNDEQMSAVFSSAAPNVEFARLWTRKEAFLKLTGEGLTQSLPDVLTESVLARVSFTTEMHIAQGCVSTVATYKENRL